MSNEREQDAEAERVLKDLFAHAKPRMQPPAADTEEIRRAVYAEWDAVTGRRVWRKRAGVAAAASVLLAVALWVGGGLNPGAPPPVVARVERVQGDVEGPVAARAAIGDELVVGTVLATGTGQVALRLASGGSLRVGPRSEIVLTGADGAELVAGVLYFDSEDRRSGMEFTVTTGLGTVRDVGTQFLVRLDDDRSELDVGVRDGRVSLMTSGESGTAGVGERLVATQNTSTIRRDAIPTFGSEWDWAEKLAPPFDIDGRTVSDFLTWFAAQTGRIVEFGSPAAERLAQQTILSGSIDLEPLQKLSAVMALTDLTATVEDGRVVIGTR
jgi:ferric-dicitrate binding protein FerR (iron transport regulator)